LVLVHIAVYINPTTGHRFVNETSERDVLSLAEFKNGVEHNGTQGVFMEISNAEEVITPYAYKNADGTMNMMMLNGVNMFVR